MKRAALALTLFSVACGAAPPQRGPDAATPGGPDAATPGGSDASADAAIMSVARKPPPNDGSPWRLSEAGLYADITRQVMAPGLIAFEPAFPLWSDGAEKRRWIDLPPGTRIDTSDMNAWRFPVGTRVWKEFSRGGVRLETRLIERTGPGDMDYWMGAFLWTEDGRDAVFVPDGAENVHRTNHDVPAAKLCWSCHQGEPGRVLGFSAVQLAQPPGAGPNLTTLAAQDRLTNAATVDPPPGDATVSAALGYLHANCGSCHSSRGIARPDSNMILRLSVEERAPEATAIYRSTIKAAARPADGVAFRVAPGAPDQSSLLLRMRSRQKETQMPPLGTKHLDEEGVALLERWIRALR